MEVLKEAVMREISQRYEDKLKKIKTTEGLKEMLSFEGKEYKGDELTQREKLRKYLINKQNKEKATQLNQIEKVSKAKAFTGEFVITIEWKDSRMWRSNPRAYTNYGFEGESIGGCGYCKLSTATAQALNSNLSILKLLYRKKDRELNKFLEKNKGKNNKNDFNRAILGYGSGYNVIPAFEGGVGITSHNTIIENLGLKWKKVTDTPSTDVYLITK